jgi:hypothetical protein
MHESTSLLSLDELQQLLKSLNERVKYLEKVVLPSRVTKEELHSEVSDAKLFVMSTASPLRADIRMLKDQQVTKAELQHLKQELSQRNDDEVARRAARSTRRRPATQS